MNSNPLIPPFFHKVAMGNAFSAPTETRHLASMNTMVASPWRSEAPQHGLLVINADDWGRNRETTDRTLECVQRGVISSVSAMVFMQDSERAAEIAREQEIDAGLHLNFTTPFSAPNCPARLVQHQQQISQCLTRYRLAQALFHPTLMRSFEYVASAQLEQFSRLYGRTPERLDGHHHMHLCANVLLARLLPRRTIVRRNFHFQPGERGFAQRLYYRAVDRLLTQRHRITDFFFSLAPLKPAERLQEIMSLARQFAVEVETHPANPDEYRFLSSGEICGFAGDVRIARGFALKASGPA